MEERTRVKSHQIFTSQIKSKCDLSDHKPVTAVFTVPLNPSLKMRFRLTRQAESCNEHFITVTRIRHVWTKVCDQPSDTLTMSVITSIVTVPAAPMQPQLALRVELPSAVLQCEDGMLVDKGSQEKLIQCSTLPSSTLHRDTTGCPSLWPLVVIIHFGLIQATSSMWQQSTQCCSVVTPVNAGLILFSIRLTNNLDERHPHCMQWLVRVSSQLTWHS